MTFSSKFCVVFYLLLITNLSIDPFRDSINFSSFFLFLSFSYPDVYFLVDISNQTIYL